MSDGMNDCVNTIFGGPDIAGKTINDCECVPMGECHCDEKYSIEPHGNGWALYRGRCNNKHGFNLAHITEASQETLDLIVSALNRRNGNA